VKTRLLYREKKSGCGQKEIELGIGGGLRPLGKLTKKREINPSPKKKKREETQIPERPLFRVRPSSLSGRGGRFTNEKGREKGEANRKRSASFHLGKKGEKPPTYFKKKGNRDSEQSPDKKKREREQSAREGGASLPLLKKKRGTTISTKVEKAVTLHFERG